MLDAGDDIRLEAFHLARQLDLVEPWEQRLQHQPQFEAREMRAGAEMLALPERDLLVRVAPKVETVWMIENGLVAVPGRHPQRQPVALANFFASQLSITRRDSRDMRNRTSPSEDLFDRARHQRCILRQALALAGILNQGEEAARDRIA